MDPAIINVAENFLLQTQRATNAQRCNLFLPGRAGVIGPIFCMPDHGKAQLAVTEVPCRVPIQGSAEMKNRRE